MAHNDALMNNLTEFFQSLFPIFVDPIACIKRLIIKRLYPQKFFNTND